MSLQRTFAVVLLSFLLSYSPLAQQQDRQSAWVWDTLILENPTVVDDPQVSWKDRLILYARKCLLRL